MRAAKAEHGTRARYIGNRQERGCRCDDCREANAVYQRNWRRKNPGLTYKPRKADR